MQALPMLCAGMGTALLVALLASLTPPSGDTLALDTVTPVTAGKNQVRWWEFDWQTATIPTVEGAAPIQLLFYEEERNVARNAAALAHQTFLEYVDRFQHAPKRETPLLLYNSHFEFQSTNAFFVQEGLLGVTDVSELTLSLPYWGDHARFREVLRHELAHVFTIDKLDAAARAQGLPSPIELLPLWFIEGLAQEVALPELTPEARLALVALVQAKELPGLLDGGAGTFERVYLVGHAQVRFLEESCGEGSWRRVLEFLTGRSLDRGPVFEAALVEVCRRGIETLERDWQAWATRETSAWRESPQKATPLEPQPPHEIDALAISPDGRTLFYRTFNRNTGRAALYLQDAAHPERRQFVIDDQRLSLESLHPLDRSVIAIGDGVLAYVGRSGPRDKIFVRRWKREGNGFELGEQVVHEPNGAEETIEAGSPAFSPDGRSLAFTGLSRLTGRTDLFVFDDVWKPGSKARRLSEDVAYESDLAWGDEGLYFVSDATPDGSSELFLRREDGEVTRLTSFSGETEVNAPRPLDDGRVLFSATGSGLPQAYVRDAEAVVRLTSLPGGMRQPVFDATGRLLGISGSQERVKLTAVAPDALQSIPTLAWTTAPPVPRELPERPLGPTEPYRALTLENLSLASVQLFAGTGPFFLGQALFTDRLKDKVIGASGQYVSDLDRSGAQLIYVDRTRRLGFSGIAFVDSSLQIDPTRLALGDTWILRRYGVTAELSWPFGRYTRVEGFLTPQGITGTDFSAPGAAFARDNTGTWLGLGAGVRLAVDTLRYLMPVGPVDGTSVLMGVSATGVLREDASYATLHFDLQRFQPLFRSLPRVYFFGRLGAIAQPGGDLAEQLFLPPAYNLRAYRFADLSVVARHAAVATLELRFPLLPLRPGWPSLEGVLGADAGTLFFEFDDAFDNRVADLAAGVNLGLGMLTLRLHFARAVDIGGGVPVDGWNTHVSIASPFFSF